MNTDFKRLKVLVYIALNHHTRFLMPIMERLEALGAQIIYVVGQAERSQEITAIELGLNYVHVFDYISEADRPEIEENYRRLRDGVSKGIKSDIAIGSTNALTVIDKTLRATAQEYIGFKNLMEVEKPSICFALHELNRWAKLMTFWAKKKGIPSLTLQEGLYVATDFIYIGHVQFSTFNLVWGKKTQQKLVGYEAPIERIIPVGNTHIAQEIIRLETGNVRSVKRNDLNLAGKRIVLLLFSLVPSPVEDLLPLFSYVSENSETQLICKFHPVTTVQFTNEWMKRIEVGARRRIQFIHDEESTYDLIAISDLCVLSEPSTTGLEALSIGRPVVQLKLSKPDMYPYDFVEEKVALHLTPEELAFRLENDDDFKNAFSPDIVQQYITDELIDTTGAVERIKDIAFAVINNNTSEGNPSFAFKSELSPALDWSIVLPVPENPELFMAVLQAISEFSEDTGTYEVIFVLGETVSDPVTQILNALEGDIKVVQTRDVDNLAVRLNLGAEQTRGQQIVCIDQSLAPTATWLEQLKKAYNRYGQETLYGAKVINTHRNILHAGMVVDSNHAPVSAYKHLDNKFPSAIKERPFQMLDYVISADRRLFCELGGFHPASGGYAFMDLCLRHNALAEDKNAYYIPDVEFVCLDAESRNTAQEDALYFFSRWHGELWDSEKALYDNDKVSQLQLDSARMTRAMNLLGSKK